MNRAAAAEASTPAVFWPLQAATLAAMTLLGVAPSADRLTWLMENAPVMLVVPLLVATRRRFPLTPLLYWMIFLHGLILMVGGHYTYAEVPVGHWVSEQMGWARNHYDRLGHLAQGFVPAIAAREVIARSTPIRRGGWLFFLAVCVPLAFSAFYEMLEWWAAIFTAEGASAFLGTQGDPWDTQWDMFLCMIGAIASQVLLGGLHARQMERYGE